METLKFIVTILVSSGIGTFIAQRIFEHRLNKKLFVFNKLYTEKVEVIKNLFTLLVKSEKALDFMLSRPLPNDDNEKEDFNKQTIEVFNNFKNYYEINEIILDTETNEIINQIFKEIDKAKIAFNYAESLEKDRNSKVWIEAVNGKIELRDSLIKREIPILKAKLRNEFRKIINY